MKVQLSLASVLVATLLHTCTSISVEIIAGSTRAPLTPSPTEIKVTPDPTIKPTEAPRTGEPTPEPTTKNPTQSPTIATPNPTRLATPLPTTEEPTLSPTKSPTLITTTNPPSAQQTAQTTQEPTKQPTAGDRPPSVSTPPVSLSPTQLSTLSTTGPSTEEDATLSPSESVFTQSPSGSNSEAGTTSTESPTMAPTGVVTKDPAASIPSQTPTRAVTAAPSLVPTLSPTQNPSQIPVQVHSTATTDPPMNAIAANPQVADPPKYDVIADVQSFSSAIDFVVGISLWSPDGIPVDDDVKLKPIKDSMLMSVRMMYCEDFTTNVCVIKDDMLLTSKDVFASPNGKQQGSVASTTLMVPRIGGVLGEGVDPLMWTSWRISFQVVQLGVQYIQELLQQLEEGSEIPVSAETILQLVPEMIKQKVTKDIEKSIREGTFDGLLHGNLGNDDIVSSVVGEEAETFQALLALPPQQAQQVQKDANDEENASTIDLTEVAIYVAIACGIIAMAACGLAYIYTTQTSKAAMAESGLAADRSRSLKDLTDLNVDSSEPSQENDTSDDGVDDDTTTPGLYPPATQSMASPSVDTGTESDTDGDLSTAVASWQVKPRRFVLQEPEVKSQATPRDEDTTSFPTSGSLVAGSVMVGSLGADSVESSLDGWSVNSYDMTWA